MDELLKKIREFFREPAPSRKVIFMLLGLTAICAFVISSLGPSTAKTVSLASASPDAPKIESPSFYVHIVGQVTNPGVYALDVGSRLFDAVVAAGGFLDKADQTSVNLARPLTDGEQIVVLKIGQTTSSIGGGSTGPAGLISLNRASEAELESLPGVGPALAGRIIDWRSANGGFKKKEDLLNVGGIGDKLFAGMAKSLTL
jgi:competence protein ComEA